MIGTDRYSYRSRLKDVDPTAKLTASFVSIVLCLGTGGMLASVTAILVFAALLYWKGGTPAGDFFRLLRVPFWFLVVGAVTVVLARFPDRTGVLWGAAIGGSVYGVSAASLLAGARLVVRALGCVASVYFTVLSTPVTDLLLALKRLHVPKLLLTLMELIYRFIFVLTETAERMRVAQQARLGYGTLRQSFHSFGTLLAMVFMRAYRRADRIYVSLEARGYEGEVQTLPPHYQSGRTVYLWCVGLTCAQLAAYLLERGLTPV